MIFDFLTKEKFCEICNTSSKISQLYGFDPSDRGKFKSYKRSLLCIDDLKKQWIDLMNKNCNAQFVAFLPKKGWNSYSYVTLDKARSWGFEKSDIAKFKEILDKNTYKCMSCDKKAKVALFPNECGSSRNWDGNIKYLCYEHFADEIIEYISRNKFKLDEVTIPSGEMGIFVGGEY